MIPGARLVILGRQGAGKGTQCVRLAQHYLVPHISTGDVLRAAVREGTDLGRKAKEIMDAGNLVPDDVMIGIVEERLGQRDAAARGFLLDGFPRTVAQADALLGILGSGGLDLAVNLDVPVEVVLQRLASRRACEECGANYSTDEPPKVPGTCDVCGGRVVHREDDTEQAIRRRLDLYERETAPLIAWFRDRGLLAEVDGMGHPDDVTARLIAVIDRRRGPRP